MKLVIFDVDGTLVDSQASIVSGMTSAFAAAGRAVLPRQKLLSIVGLSLPEAFRALVPDADETENKQMVEAYKETYVRDRETGAVSATLYPGARETLAALAARDDVLLGVATGKSRRGLDILLSHHGWQDMFQTLQVADFHPSKPHPSMIHAALDETGVAQADAVMVGDTSFDVEMACAAGIAAVGVDWGYHLPENLVQAGATRIISSFQDLVPTISDIWGW